jgi:AbiV family abortive infection protein
MVHTLNGEGNEEMTPKATKDMVQLKTDDFIREVAKELDLVFDNVMTLADDARFSCESGRYRGGRILLAFAEEEAAKILILLDAVRAPRNHPNLAQHLGGFNEHLAKGIYIEYCRISPHTFEEAVHYLQSLRPDLYIDTDDYQVWIGRNDILQKREDLIYVSRIRDSENNHSWNSPLRYPEDLRRLGCNTDISAILRLISAMRRCGFMKEAGLREIGRIWQPIEMKTDFHISDIEKLNFNTLEALNAAGLLEESSSDDHRAIQRDWYYPLYSVDLSPIRVKLTEAVEWKREQEALNWEQLY